MQKTSEATGDLIEYETTNKVTEKKNTCSRGSTTRNIYATKKMSTNYLWFKIDLKIYKNQITENCKSIRQIYRYNTTKIWYKRRIKVHKQ